MLFVAALWLNSIRLQRIQQSGQLKIQILKPKPENVLIDQKEIKENVLRYLKKDLRKIKSHALNLYGLEAKLESLPVVHHAEVYLDANQNLHIDVYQRDPLVRILEAQGDSYYLDAEGNKIPGSSRYSARVPVATGLSGQIGKNSSIKGNQSELKNIFYLAQEIARDTFAQALVEQIDVQPSGDVVLIPKIGSEKIMFGKVEDVNEKLQKLHFFYQEGLRYEGWNVYQTIDLQNKDQVVCKRNVSQL
jgi:cell division protein FtsQ